jgi:hypothetical protein
MKIALFDSKLDYFMPVFRNPVDSLEIDETRLEIDETRLEIDETRFEIDETRLEIDERL